MEIEKNRIGSRPAFPQSPCPKCLARGFIIEPQLRSNATDGRAQPDFAEEKCGVCHGTGLVGGGLTVREYFAAAAMSKIHLSPDEQVGWKVAETVGDALWIAAAMIAALAAREDG